MGRVLRLCVTAACMAVLLAGSPASSQSLGSLRGKVTDPGGAAVANATVHLTNSSDGSDRVATTDPSGAYAFSDVTPGKYRLRVEAQGFDEFEETDLDLTASAPKTADVKLQIRQVQQSVTVRSEEGDECIAPQARILPEVGPGLRALRTGPSGNYYALTAPGASVAIYSPDGKLAGRVPAAASASSPGAAIVSGSDLQVDSAGRVFVADFAANAVKIYSAEGALEKSIRVPAPISVLPLPGGEVAVASVYSKHLADIYDEQRGELFRSIGDTEEALVLQCDESSLSCTPPAKMTQQPSANRNWFYGDSAGNLYVTLVDSPSPTIRKYDGYGYLAFESSIPFVRTASGSGNSGWGISPDVRVAGLGTVGLSTDGSQSYNTTSGNSSSSNSTTAGASPSGGRGAFGGGGGEMRGGGGGMRGGGGGGATQFGLRITQRNVTPEQKPAIQAVGVDPASDDTWAAVAGLLVHFDKEGALAGYYCLSTSDRTPVKPTTIIVEPNRILVGSDPFGVYQYPRPDKPQPQPDPPASH